MKPESFSRVAWGLLAGLDLLFLSLVCLTTAAAIRHQEHPWTVLLLAAAFLGCYWLGRATLNRPQIPLDASRARWWPEGAWILALFLGWTALLWFSEVALWLAFPLMLLQLHIFGPKIGLIAVMVTASASIGHGLSSGLQGWASLGTVVGPMVGAGVAIAAVLGLEALAREGLQRQRLVEELTEARHYLAEAERDRAIFDERERLAREIHDTLAQGFSALDLLLRAATAQLSDGPVRDLLLQANQTAKDNLAEARRFVRALTPAGLDGTTLVAAVRRVSKLSAGLQPGLKVNVEVDGSPRGLPITFEAALLRITQSALANVVHHAEATQAEVRLSYQPNQIGLSITDNGSGFVVGDEPQGGGYGLIGIRSRVRELGGQLTIDTAEGAGTKLVLSIPLADDQEMP